jgi:hypothetical protein
MLPTVGGLSSTFLDALVDLSGSTTEAAEIVILPKLREFRLE